MMLPHQVFPPEWNRDEQDASSPTWESMYDLWRAYVTAHCPDLLSGFKTINVLHDRGYGFTMEANFVAKGAVRTRGQALAAVSMGVGYGRGVRATAEMLAEHGADPERVAMIFIAATGRLVSPVRGRTPAPRIMRLVSSVSEAIEGRLGGKSRAPEWHHRVTTTLPPESDLYSNESPVFDVDRMEGIVRLASLQAALCRFNLDVVVRLLPGHGLRVQPSDLPEE